PGTASWATSMGVSVSVRAMTRPTQPSPRGSPMPATSSSPTTHSRTWPSLTHLLLSSCPPGRRPAPPERTYPAPLPGHPSATRPGTPSGRPTTDRPDDVTRRCSVPEGRLEELGLLALVDLARARRRRGGLRAGDDGELAPPECVAEVVRDVRPWPLVAGFVLDPDDVGARVAVELGLHRVELE